MSTEGQRLMKSVVYPHEDETAYCTMALLFQVKVS